MICCLLLLEGCSSRGRVVVILDNSGSMAKAGMPFEEIKQTLIRALYLLPSSYDIGLRVFDDQVKGSTRIVEYTRNIDVIRGALEKIQPKSGTFIGASLLEATGDLLAAPQGNNRLILITDGEGNDGDIAQAFRSTIPTAATHGLLSVLFHSLFNSKERPLRNAHWQDRRYSWLRSNHAAGGS